MVRLLFKCGKEIQTQSGTTKRIAPQKDRPIDNERAIRQTRSLYAVRQSTATPPRSSEDREGSSLQVEFRRALFWLPLRRGILGATAPSGLFGTKWVQVRRRYPSVWTPISRQCLIPPATKGDCVAEDFSHLASECPPWISASRGLTTQFAEGYSGWYVAAGRTPAATRQDRAARIPLAAEPR